MTPFWIPITFDSPTKIYFSVESWYREKKDIAI